MNLAISKLLALRFRNKVTRIYHKYQIPTINRLVLVIYQYQPDGWYLVGITKIESMIE